MPLGLATPRHPRRRIACSDHHQVRTGRTVMPTSRKRSKPDGFSILARSATTSEIPPSMIALAQSRWCARAAHVHDPSVRVVVVGV